MKKGRINIIPKVMILFFLSLGIIKPIKAQNDKKIYDIIDNEFWYINETYNKRILPVRYNCEPINNFKIVNLDTIKLNLRSKHIYSSEIIKVSLKFTNSAIVNAPRIKSKDLKNDTLNYYLIYDFLGRYYKLFGFFNSEVNLFLYNLGELNGSSFIKEIVNCNILTPKEGKILKRTIQKKLTKYPDNLGKPCEFLKYFTDERDKSQASSNILPVLKISYP